jgi:hypothetical protein
MANKNEIMKSIKAARGLDRADHFANGGTMIDWMGGPHLIVKNKKKTQNKKACRGQVRY